MAQVAVTKVNDAEKKTLPVFGEIAKRLDAVQRRAFDLFEKRGRELGHELEDWLKAEHELFGWPAAELAEKNGAYEIGITLPGFEAKDVEVTATPGELIIHAATQKEQKTEKDNVLWTEFGSNDVYRRFDVPNAINVDQVTAKLDNGILRVIAPKIAKAKETKAVAA
ncbi:MAG: Hsp20 family protein [Acidobacteriia bacterium]|nr:Hsp20 family protein [Terriglobia bacterium]